MCVSPITINNPRKDKIQYYDREKLTVPCGNCWQCRLTKQNDLYIRAFFEYQRTLECKGTAIFFTLTYDPAHLPTIKLSDGKVVPCFSREDWRKFTKSLWAKFDKDVLRYFMVSEYGDEKHRPHYHGILYVNSPYYSVTAIQNAIKSSWNRGIVNFGDINCGVLVDDRAIRYVSKYCCKDLVQQRYYENLVQPYKEKVDNYNKAYHGDATLAVVEHLEEMCTSAMSDLQLIDKHKPFQRHSLEFGYNMLETTNGVDAYSIKDIEIFKTLDFKYKRFGITATSVLNGCIIMPNTVGTANSASKPFYTYVLPVSVERKLCMQAVTGDDKSRKFYPSALGRQIRLHRLPSVVKACRRVRDELRQTNLSWQTLQSLKSPVISKYDSYEDFKRALDAFCKFAESDLMAIYKPCADRDGIFHFQYEPTSITFNDALLDFRKICNFDRLHDSVDDYLDYETYGEAFERYYQISLMLSKVNCEYLDLLLSINDYVKKRQNEIQLQNELLRIQEKIIRRKEYRRKHNIK